MTGKKRRQRKFRRLHFQSRNPEVRRFYRKKYSLKKYRDLVARLKKRNIDVILKIEVGTPGDTMAGLLETLRQAYSLKPNKIDLVRFKIVPGDDFTQNNSRLKIKWALKYPHEIISHYRSSRHEIDWQYKISDISVSSYNYWSDLYGNRRKIDIQDQCLGAI